MQSPKQGRVFFQGVIATTGVLAIMGVNLPVAHAQEASSAVLEEIVVSARKTTESLQDVPSAVSAVTAESMAGAGLSTVADLMSVVPSLTINTDGDNRSLVQIRGVGLAIQAPIQPGVGLFMDGVYVPYTSSFNDNLLDTAQVEVIRGPQGTLFGKNTLGGAINVISKQPSEEFSGAVAVRFGSEDDSYGIDARLSGPLVDNLLLGSLSVSHKTSDGFYEHAIVGGNWDERESSAVKGALKWFVGEEGTLRINASVGEYDGPASSNTAIPGNDVDASNFDGKMRLNLRPESEAEISRVNAIYESPVSERTNLSLTLGYDSRDLSTVQDQDFTVVDIVRGFAERQDDFYQIELRFETQISDNLRLMYAGFYSDQETTSEGELLVPSIGISTFTTSDIDDKTYSLYGNVFWEFADSWELSLGVRYDEFDQVGVFTESRVVPGTGAPVRFTINETPFTPMVSLKKYFSDDMMVYVSYAQAPRAGGFNGILAPEGFQTFNGDEVTSYELGFKSTFADGRAALNMALYRAEQDDIILNDLAPDETGALIVVNKNLGRRENTGVEAELSVALTPAWTLRAGGSYVSTDIKEDPTGFFDIYNDESSFWLPETQGSVTLSYQAALGSGNLASTFGVFYTGSLEGAGATAPEFTRAPQIDSYTVMNFSADYTVRNLTIGLFATNLTDEDYFQGYLAESVLGAVGFEQAVGVKAPPRNFGVRASYSF